jgi:hypothetical protein
MEPTLVSELRQKMIFRKWIGMIPMNDSVRFKDNLLYSIIRVSIIILAVVILLQAHDELNAQSEHSREKSEICLTEISHKYFEVHFPASWKVVITDHFPDRDLFGEVFEFELNPPGRNLLTFSVWSKPVPPTSYLLMMETKIWNSILGEAQIDSFTYWGGYEGEGLHLFGIPFEHLKMKYSGFDDLNVRIFTGASDSCAFIVTENWYGVNNTDIASFRQIEDSFILKK